MKKALAILISAVLFASGMHISIDRHYCGGSLADIKISVTGKLASCGMERSDTECQNHPLVNQKCCEDKISYFTICSNYFPEYFSFDNSLSGKDISHTQTIIPISGNSYNCDLISRVLPPGYYLKSALTQPEICIFRI